MRFHVLGSAGRVQPHRPHIGGQQLNWLLIGDRQPHDGTLNGLAKPQKQQLFMYALSIGRDLQPLSAIRSRLSSLQIKDRMSFHLSFFAEANSTCHHHNFELDCSKRFVKAIKTLSVRSLACKLLPLSENASLEHSCFVSVEGTKD